MQAEIRLTGVTSESNRAFVGERSVRDAVVAYREIDRIGRDATCVIDIAGNHASLTALHTHLKGALARSIQVGDTSQSGAAAEGLIDPQPVLFFAPDQIRQRRRDWGAE